MNDFTPEQEKVILDALCFYSLEVDKVLAETSGRGQDQSQRMILFERMKIANDLIIRLTPDTNSTAVTE